MNSASGHGGDALRAVRAVAVESAAGAPVDRLAQVVVDALTGAMRYPIARVMFVASSSPRLVPVAAAEHGKAVEVGELGRRSLSSLHPLVGRLMVDGEAVATGDTREDRDLGIAFEGASAVACASIVHEARVVGAVAIGLDGPADALEPADVELLRLMALQLGGAIGTAELRAELAAASRSELIGRVARGVVHDVNNLITLILASCDSLEAAAETDVSRTIATRLRAASAGVLQLTATLTRFVRQGTTERRPLGLHDLIRDCAPVLSRLAGQHVEVVLRLDAARDAILADRGEIEQVLMNLAVNAGHAIPARGTLAFETTDGRAADGSTELVLRVRDSGRGMDRETLRSLLQPPPSPRSHAGGVGLDTVRRVVAELGARLDIESTPGLGTCFVIAFGSR